MESCPGFRYSFWFISKAQSFPQSFQTDSQGKKGQLSTEQMNFFFMVAGHGHHGRRRVEHLAARVREGKLDVE